MNEDIDIKLLNKYEIIQRIHIGKSSIIWKAIYKKSNKLVILKKVIINFKR